MLNTGATSGAELYTVVYFKEGGCTVRGWLYPLTSALGQANCRDLYLPLFLQMPTVIHPTVTHPQIWNTKITCTHTLKIYMHIYIHSLVCMKYIDCNQIKSSV